MQPQKLENDLRHEVEDVVDSEVEEDKSMIQLQARWDDLMGASSQSTLHQKVIVLILYWNKVDDSSMDVEDEVSLHPVDSLGLFELMATDSTFR